MAGYDGSTMPPQSAPVKMMRMPDMDEGYGHGLDFSGEAMFNDLNVDLSSLPVFTPTSYDFTSGFEDTSAYYNAGYFETLLDSGAPVPEFPSADLDNKLLGFGAAIHKTPVIDGAGQTWPRLTAELNGMFSIAEDVFEGDTAGRPLELTCYRRNLFQIAGAITLSRNIGHLLLDQGRHVPIHDLLAVLSATESIEGKSTEIISVPWKSGLANGLLSSEDKAGSAPANIPIDLTSNQEADSALVSIPIAWRRLQFKYATANNGRRKGLQQHYQIQIALMAKIEEDNQLVKIAEIHSNPIIVRGRSPKNFDSSKDVHLNERKQSDAASRNRSTGSVAATTPQWIEPAISQESKHHSQKSFQQPPENILSWPHASPILSSPALVEPRAKKPASASPMAQRRRQPIPATQWQAAEIKDETRSATLQRPPVGLSLSDDDLHIHISDASASSAETIVHKPSVTSPLETIDQLYEYFPLSLDDWMPPVDAIYRPHVVHHLRTPADVKAQEVRQKPKRYFSASDD